jgi:hypothetical protein
MSRHLEVEVGFGQPALPVSAQPAAFAQNRGGAVLLEVVMALTLLFTTAAVITGSLNISIASLGRIKLQSQAENLAVSKLSELQMGLIGIADSGPNNYRDDDRLADWTWQVSIGQADDQTIIVAHGISLKRVEVIIRNTAGDYTYRLVHFLPSRDDQNFDDAGGSQARPAQLAKMSAPSSGDGGG